MSRERPVREIMTTEVVSVSPDTPLEETLRLLSRHHISGVPVVDGEGRLAGLLDDSDLLVGESRLHGPTAVELLGAWIPIPGERRRYEEEVRRALAYTAGEAMDADPVTVGPDATVEDVATLIVHQHLSRVPVVGEDDKLVGIVTRGDLVGAMGRSA